MRELLIAAVLMLVAGDNAVAGALLHPPNRSIPVASRTKLGPAKE
jgi:hypothetical protein